MVDRLPPLTALRAFEAAARHMSFALAAEELAVTPAALSYQIKNLEAHLQAPLFRRLNRAVELTEAGAALLPYASEGFDALRQGWRAAQRTLEGAVLNITAGPAFTAKWLAPKLFRFAQQNPDIELRFSATLRVLDFDRDAVDLAIRFGQGRDEGYFSEALYRGWITPMMRPDIAARVASPADLLKENLIHDESLDFLRTPPNWACWFQHAGVDAAQVRGPHFTQADHALDMALEGGGVALGRSSIALTALQSGALVAPFPLALTVDAHYRMVCPLGHETRPRIARFREWIHAELAAAAPLAEGREFVHIE
ncbi:transcriptional regulator GcvA [Oceanibium sediminis]|uniref:transcriptional regulator GcvA n=1 Tax=Oceanibium sediminis TaxID=2026339 RepID=UPI000DD36D23|nr:transcriptional regulator GcvA [Oceanibium sediminis]